MLVRHFWKKILSFESILASLIYEGKLRSWVTSHGDEPDLDLNGILGP